MKTGNRRDERRKRVRSHVPGWMEVGMAENRQDRRWLRLLRGHQWPLKRHGLALYLCQYISFTFSFFFLSFWPLSHTPCHIFKKRTCPVTVLIGASASHYEANSFFCITIGNITIQILRFLNCFYSL